MRAQHPPTIRQVPSIRKSLESNRLGASFKIDMYLPFKFGKGSRINEICIKAAALNIGRIILLATTKYHNPRSAIGKDVIWSMAFITNFKTYQDVAEG